MDMYFRIKENIEKNQLMKDICVTEKQKELLNYDFRDMENTFYFGKGRQNGLTSAILIRSIYESIKNYKNKICIITENLKLKQAIIPCFNSIMNKLKHEQKQIEVNNSRIEFNNGSVIEIFSSGSISNNIRGKRFDSIYVDNSNLDYIQKRDITNAILISNKGKVCYIER